MTELFGATRNVVKERYALLTPGGFVPSVLPGWENATGWSRNSVRIRNRIFPRS